MDLGAEFRVKREQRGLTLETVAARTKIPRRYLADLEMNDVSRWPKDRIYRVGFLRAYAKELALDADSVIAAFSSRGLGATAELQPTSGNADARAWRAVIAAAAAGAVLLVGTVVFPVRFQARETAASPAVAGERPNDVRLDFDATAPTSGQLATAAGEEAPDAGSTVEGTLFIESTPGGTWVTINGIGRGATPLELEHLPLGAYTIRLVRDGYEARQTLVTLTRQTATRSVRLNLTEQAR